MQSPYEQYSYSSPYSGDTDTSMQDSTDESVNMELDDQKSPDGLMYYGNYENDRKDDNNNNNNNNSFAYPNLKNPTPDVSSVRPQPLYSPAIDFYNFPPFSLRHTLQEYYTFYQQMLESYPNSNFTEDFINNVDTDEISAQYNDFCMIFHFFIKNFSRLERIEYSFGIFAKLRKYGFDLESVELKNLFARLSPAQRENLQRYWRIFYLVRKPERSKEEYEEIALFLDEKNKPLHLLKTIADTSQRKLMKRLNPVLLSANRRILDEKGFCNGDTTIWIGDKISGAGDTFSTARVFMSLCSDDLLKKMIEQITVFSEHVHILQNPEHISSHQGSLGKNLNFIYKNDLFFECSRGSLVVDKNDLIELLKYFGQFTPDKGTLGMILDHTIGIYGQKNTDLERYEIHCSNDGERSCSSIEKLADKMFFSFRNPENGVIPKYIPFGFRIFQKITKTHEFSANGENFSCTGVVSDKEKIPQFRNFLNKIIHIPNYALYSENEKQILYRKAIEQKLFQKADDGTGNLLLAVTNNDEELVRFFGQLGCDPNEENNAKISPLWHAIFYNYPKIVKLLFQFKIKLRVQPDDIETFFDVSIANGHIETIKIILQQDCRLHFLTNQHKRRLKEIFQNTSNTELKECIGGYLYAQEEAARHIEGLLEAIRNNEIKIVENILSLDRIHCFLTLDYKALLIQLAEVTFNIEIQNCLIKYIKDKSKVDVFPDEMGDAFFNLLVKLGADVDHRDRNGNTRLAYFVTKNNIPQVEFCLARKADINAQNIAKFTPLMIAAANGHYQIAQLLVKDSRLDPNLTNIYGETALEVAAGKQNTDMINLFESYSLYTADRINLARQYVELLQMSAQIAPEMVTTPVSQLVQTAGVNSPVFTNVHSRPEPTFTPPVFPVITEIHPGPKGAI